MSNLDTPQVIEEQEINNPNEIQKNLSLEYLKFILKEIKISSTSKNYYKIEIPNDYFMPKHPVYLNYIIPKNSWLKRVKTELTKRNIITGKWGNTKYDIDAYLSDSFGNRLELDLSEKQLKKNESEVDYIYNYIDNLDIVEIDKFIKMLELYRLSLFDVLDKNNLLKIIESDNPEEAFAVWEAIKKRLSTYDLVRIVLNAKLNEIKETVWYFSKAMLRPDWLIKCAHSFKRKDIYEEIWNLGKGEFQYRDLIELAQNKTSPEIKQNAISELEYFFNSNEFYSYNVDAVSAIQESKWIVSEDFIKAKMKQLKTPELIRLIEEWKNNSLIKEAWELAIQKEDITNNENIIRIIEWTPNEKVAIEALQLTNNQINPHDSFLLILNTKHESISKIIWDSDKNNYSTHELEQISQYSNIPEIVSEAEWMLASKETSS